jgi:hypothetical protein
MREFFASLKRLQCSKGSVDYCFVNDADGGIAQDLIHTLDVKDATRCCFMDARKEPSSAYFYVWKLADYKERILEYARKNNYDYLFLVDSKIVLHPKTLNQLISAKKDIVANVFWTTTDAEPTPQVWLSDAHNQCEIGVSETVSNEERTRREKEFFARLKTPGVHQVGGLGACTLISKNALDKGVSYQRLKNVSFYSEDAHFCLRAEALDIPLFVDTHYPVYCLLRDTGDSSLEGVEAFKTQL